MPTKEEILTKLGQVEKQLDDFGDRLEGLVEGGGNIRSELTWLRSELMMVRGGLTWFKTDILTEGIKEQKNDLPKMQTEDQTECQ